MTVTIGDRQFSETADIVDPNFFQIIQLPLIAGDRYHLVEAAGLGRTFTVPRT